MLNLLGPGEVLGEMSAVDLVPASATAQAMEPTTLLWMPREAFKYCLFTVPQLLVNLSRLQNSRMRRLTGRVESIVTRDVRSRLAMQLLTFAEDYGRQVKTGNAKPEAVLLPMRLKQSDLGGLIGASREQVNRVLSIFQDHGFLSIGPSYSITLHDMDALRQQIKDARH